MARAALRDGLHCQPIADLASPTQGHVPGSAGRCVCIRRGWIRSRERIRSLRSRAMGLDPAAVDTGALGFICHDAGSIDGVSAAALAASPPVRIPVGTPCLRLRIARIRGGAVLTTCVAWAHASRGSLGRSAVTAMPTLSYLQASNTRSSIRRVSSNVLPDPAASNAAVRWALAVAQACGSRYWLMAAPDTAPLGGRTRAFERLRASSSRCIASNRACAYGSGASGTASQRFTASPDAHGPD